ncbi:MAG: oxidoreductase [Hyphomicrobium sp.]|jgi:NAD(P)H-quinone oxidoreductase subunit 5|nr:oxidoreductase [Hyphomicrobium sp.]
MWTPFLPFAAPAVLALAALVAAIAPRQHPRVPALLAEAAAAIAFLAGLVTAWQLIQNGPSTSQLIGIAGIGLSARIDAVSVTMLLLVSFVGWIVVRYAATYLDGEPGQGRFTALLTATLAAVLLLVSAGNLVQLAAAWIATSLLLHKLLLFYPDRIAAQRAARKKFVAARAGDIALAGAAALLAYGFATTDIASILDLSRSSAGEPFVIAAAVLLAIAAIFKSAQFPMHGWLTEVMEAPTPVSALLHAGVINAGGFLLIRFADVMLAAPGVLAALALVGGFTALFGGVVMLTQPAVKTSLAWSTVAQMGFMIFQCGLALFPLALLHIVAHSLYKAHAFLASGSAVELIAANRRPGPVAVPSGMAIVKAFAIALAMYALIGAGFGFSEKSPQAVALGAILIFGVAYLIAQGLADAAPRELTLRTAIYSAAAAVGYFALQAAAVALTADALPATPGAGPLDWAMIVTALLTFGFVAIVQSAFPLWSGHPAAASLRVHLSNGLYANAIVDRILGNWSARKPA